MLKNKLIAKIHVLKAQLNIADDDYRNLLKVLTKNSSAGKCTQPQLVTVTNYLDKLAGNKTKPYKQHQCEYLKTNCSQIRKIMALWGELGKKGVLNNPKIKGLNGFLLSKFNTQILDINEANKHQDKKNQIIEGLKQWIERRGKNSSC